MTPEVSGQTILVTGGAGFIGSHIVDALVTDNEVRVLDNFSTGNSSWVPDSAMLFEGDIRDSKLVAKAAAGVDLIFHQAAVVSVDKSINDPVTTHKINSTATVELLEIARREDARVVLASSASIYGNPSSVPIPESERKKPESPYGMQKLSLDRYAQLYNELYGLETTSLRYFNVYGPRQSAGDYSGVISTFLEQAKKGEPITINGDGEQTRDFVYIDDVVRANLQAASTNAEGRAFNIGTGQETTIRELAELIRELTDSSSRVINTDPRQGDIKYSCADISAAQSSLRYTPQVFPREGIKRLLEHERTKSTII